VTTKDDEDNLLRSVALQNATSILIARQRAEARSEAALREQANLLNLTHDSIFVRGMDDVITYWNRGAEELYGWTAEKAVGKVSHQLTHTVFPTPIDEIRAELLRTGRWEGELVRTKADGTQVVVASRWSLQSDERQRPLAILETNNDITERKRGQALLIGEKRILEMVAKGDSLETVLEALCLFVEDQSSGVLSSILLLDPNGSCLRHGAAPSLPKSYTEAIDGAAIGPRVGSCGTAAYRAEQVVVSDIARDPLWTDYKDLALAHGLRACWSTPIISSEGKVLGTFAMYHREPGSPSPQEHDLIEQITHLAGVALERKRTEDALRQAQANLAHVSRVTTMGELTASLAHEVNQPIAAAVTNANTCLRWLAASTPNLEEARAAAMRIVKDGTRAAEIISRIRLLFKKGTPERELVDVNEVIREMIVLLRGEATRYSISFRTELGVDLPQVMGDRVQLQQVFMNLMLNGIEAMKDLGSTGELTINLRQAEDGQLLISVSDTGVGLPAQQKDQIFNAFFTTKAHGTGMGLSISRSIVESHGGRLWATANPGRGATFHLTLPTKGEAHN
jgi:PAS domain S-box-containing protein